MLTPTTKSDVHDQPINSKEIIEQGIIEEKLWKQIEEISLKLFARGQEIAASRGLILVDTKYEFGLDENGNLTLIDEIHTPDSSRYWQVATYQQKFDQGLEPEYFDKEFLRLWFKENCDPYKDAVLPQAPKELVNELSNRYIRIYEQFTGQKFIPQDNEPIIERIAKNLKPYQIQ